MTGKQLDRDLGLYAVFTVSIGGMIGSGLFVLPGLAFEIAGPSLILAYFLAGLLVLPAAFSKTEMATAMPHAGGTYLYVDRAMGPLMGTLTGFGVWFSLVFKSAFALVGLGAYLALLAPGISGKTVALALGAVLILVNILGVKQTTRLQALVVTAVMAVLVLFVGLGSTHVQSVRYEPFLPFGAGGLVEAAAIVFVSYAGVTKVASIAEEVRQPGKNLPVGILSSMGLMLVLYPLIVFVIVGVTPAADLAGDVTPVATAADRFLGSTGHTIVAIAAVLALVGMSNAGILASSRYPFAMARNSLAPAQLERVGRSTGTPITSIAVTGGVMLLLIAFVPILELAKFGSAFQLLVFALVNLALIAFRESGLEWYRPGFRSPFYPWVQLVGVLGSLFLVTTMGWVPLVGTVVITVGGVLWYRAFGRTRANRESATVEALRLRSANRLVAMTENELRDEGKRHVLIPVTRDTPPETQRQLVSLAARFARGEGGRIQVMRFEQVPEQMSLEAAAARKTDEEELFEHRVDLYAQEFGARARIGEIVSHNRRHAILHYIEEQEVDLVLGSMPDERSITARLFTDDVRWLQEHAPCDTAFLQHGPLRAIRRIAIMGSGGPYDILKISLANRIAVATEAEIRFVHILGDEAPEGQLESVRQYHAQLDELCEVATSSVVQKAPELLSALEEAADGADLVVLGAAAHGLRVFTELTDRIATRISGPILLVHGATSREGTFLGRLLERFIY